MRNIKEQSKCTMKESSSAKKFIAIVAIGNQDQEFLRSLTEIVLKCDCKINECKASLLGDKLSISALITGNWNAIAKAESALARVAEEENLSIQIKKTSEFIGKGEIPYLAETFAPRRPELVNEILKFFINQKTRIIEVQVSTYLASITRSDMQSIQLTVGIPENIAIGGLRNDFVDFCENCNIDAVLEPVK